jgi:hypothetical protein
VRSIHDLTRRRSEDFLVVADQDLHGHPLSAA